MVKHRGGRGRMAPQKHVTVTISLPPKLKAVLDSATTPEISRSEVVARLIETHLVTVSIPDSQQSAGGGRPARVRKTKVTSSLPEIVTVVQTRCPRGEAMRWDRERYEKTDALLGDGVTLRRVENGADYRTERGNIMSWRTVQALLKLGVLVAALT